MYKYAATFIPGCQEIIVKQLKKHPVAELKIVYVDDSFTIFESNLPLVQLQNFRFFNNIFLVVVNKANAESLDELLETSVQETQDLPDLEFSGSFRLLLSENGELRRSDSANFQKLVKKISVKYGIRESAHRPTNEFWIFLRNNGKGVFALKLQLLAFKKIGLARGKLRPQLAHLLNLVAGTTARDTVLDPFAGAGSIPEESLNGFHAKQAIAIEKDKKLAGLLMRNNKVSVEQADATDMNFLESGSVNKIITDPPWGKFGNYDSQELETIYKQFIAEAQRVLAPGGVLVILSSASKLMDELIVLTKNLSFIKSYSILVSGKKTNIYKFRKI